MEWNELFFESKRITNSHSLYQKEAINYVINSYCLGTTHTWIWIAAAISGAVLVMTFCIFCYLLRRRKLSGMFFD